MSVTKFNAVLSAPTAESVGISAGPEQNTMICVAFEEVEVYGKNGSAWELIGTTTSDDKVVFVPFTTYSEVYLKSNTEKVEVVRALFMEDSLVKSAAPTPTTVSDIGDMPSFGPSDEGKVLSVDSAGNLVWIAR